MAKVMMPQPTSRYFYPWAITLVSCTDAEGNPNVITIGASSICSSSPPTLGIAVGVSQYSMSLIAETGDFGANLPGAAQLYETDFCGSHSGRTVNKFASCGLTARPSRYITAPLIDECPVSMECKVIHNVPLGNHNWVIGEIVAVHVDETLLDAGGGLDFEALSPLLSCWGEYYGLGSKLADWHYSRGK